MTDSRTANAAKMTCICFMCKSPRRANEGEWFEAASKDRKLFLCKGCERGIQPDYQRVERPKGTP